MRSSHSDRLFSPSQDEAKEDWVANAAYRGLIFCSSRPEDNYRKLHQRKKVYLIRESREPGMLTVDFRLAERSRKYGSMRFAFLPEEGGWSIVGDGQISAVREKMLSIQLDCEHLGAYVKQLLDLVEQKLSLDRSDMLLPSLFEQSRNSVYTMYTMVYLDPSEENRQAAEALLQENSCPITDREGSELEQPVYLFGQIYEKEAIEAWVSEKGTCPRTRQPATLEDIRPTSGVSRLANCLG